MEVDEILQFDYKNQIRPLLADCIYYHGLNALPEMMRFAIGPFVHVAPGPQVVEQIFEKVPSKLLPQFFEAAKLYHGEGGFTCDDDLPSLEDLLGRITKRTEQILDSHSSQYDEFFMFFYIVRDLCAAYKSTGATSSSVRVVMEWNLGQTLETVVDVADQSEEDSRIPAYVAPNIRSLST
jgi:hypothetical protein